MIIAFTSLYHGAYTTSNLLAVTEALAERENLKVLAMQTHYSMNNLEMPLIGHIGRKEDENAFFDDIGLDAVIRHFKAGTLSKETVENSSISISDNITLLSGTRQNEASFKSEMGQKVILNVISKMASYYDAVIVDTNAGLGDLTREVLKMADKVVVCLRQNRSMIEEAINNSFIRSLDTESFRLYYLIGSYDDESRFNLHEIRRAFPYDIHSGNLGCIPYLTRYCDAISYCRAHEFLTSEQDVGNDREDDSDFVYSICNFVDMLMKKKPERKKR